MIPYRHIVREEVHRGDKAKEKTPAVSPRVMARIVCRVLLQWMMGSIWLHWDRLVRALSRAPERAGLESDSEFKFMARIQPRMHRDIRLARDYRWLDESDTLH